MRPALVEQLRNGVQGKVSIISAPAGFGKTTLFSAWMAAPKESYHQPRIAWVSLDEEDNDPAHFFSYLAAALQGAAPGAAHALASLLAANSANPRGLVMALIQGWFERESAQDVVLALDDYHHITSQPIHDALTYLVDYLPQDLHLVIISRAESRCGRAREAPTTTRA